MEGEADHSLVSMSKNLRSHFGEPNATTLPGPGNAKQKPSETAQEILIRMMSLWQKVLSVLNEDKCGYSTSLIQNRFLHAIIVELCNDSMN